MEEFLQRKVDSEAQKKFRDYENIDISVPQFKLDYESKVNYCIILKDYNSSLQGQQRYSELNRFYTDIKELDKKFIKSLPEFPAKTIFDISKNEDALAKRLIDLANFLKQFAGLKKYNKKLIDFLIDKDHEGKQVQWVNENNIIEQDFQNNRWQTRQLSLKKQPTEAAVTIANGGIILVGGRFRDAPSSQIIVIRDEQMIVTNQTLKYNRVKHAVAISNKVLFIIGGVDSNKKPILAIEKIDLDIFDPMITLKYQIDQCTKTNVSKINPRVQEQMSNIFMTSIHDNKFVLERFIINENTCQLIIAENDMNVYETHGMVLLGSKAIIVFGGTNENGQRSQVCKLINPSLSSEVVKPLSQMVVIDDVSRNLTFHDFKNVYNFGKQLNLQNVERDVWRIEHYPENQAKVHEDVIFTCISDHSLY